ncbi:MAG: hypothetical protein VX246_13850 [Myxococcota bacterium]|nr:hypothetical protein [Myxococcota bacterium]
MASWVSLGPAVAPQAMNALNSVAGQYNTGPGILGLAMNIRLPAQESMHLPTSIEAAAYLGAASAVPSLSPRGFALLAVCLLGFGVATASLRRRGRARG